VTVSLVVALDQAEPDAARACVVRLRGSVDGFKVGSTLFTRSGPALVTELADAGNEIFLDLKFHDTPATVAGAVTAAADLGVWLLTVHATGGPAMLEAAREAAERARGRRPLLVAVTVLTSLDRAAYARVAGPGARPLDEAARSLAHLAVAAGLDGVVCAASEAAELRIELGPQPLIVVPGIRPRWSASDHAGQARTATPAEAVAAGASILVLGRAITAASDPEAAADRVRSEIAATSPR
jgi:orotidine-5'-phosphate decarboxylase